MSFLLRKKSFRFDVNLEAEELTAVPFVSGVLFAKVRLHDGGQKSVWTTPREEVVNHVVRWRTTLRFPVKLSASIMGGALEKCICRVSVRKELKGGKSYQKLGFVDINLSEFAGMGFASQRYLLEGYDSKRRLDNSLLKINVCITLLSGDPCFKVPRAVRSTQIVSGASSEDAELHSGNKGAVHEEYISDSLNSRSSGFGSLSQGELTDGNLRISDLDKETITVKTSVYDDNSLRSQKSQSSFDYLTTDAFQRSLSVNYKRSADTYSQRFTSGFGPLQHKLDTNSVQFINAEQLVDELLQETNCYAEKKPENSDDVRLQLFVTNDGRALVGSASPVRPSTLSPGESHASSNS